MEYERALVEARKGGKLMRPHWHWVYLALSKTDESKLAIYDEHGDRERDTFKPTRSDRKATDWVKL